MRLVAHRETDLTKAAGMTSAVFWTWPGANTFDQASADSIAQQLAAKPLGMRVLYIHTLLSDMAVTFTSLLLNRLDPAPIARAKQIMQMVVAACKKIGVDSIDLVISNREWPCPFMDTGEWSESNPFAILNRIVMDPDAREQIGPELARLYDPTDPTRQAAQVGKGMWTPFYLTIADLVCRRMGQVEDAAIFEALSPFKELGATIANSAGGQTGASPSFTVYDKNGWPSLSRGNTMLVASPQCYFDGGWSGFVTAVNAARANPDSVLVVTDPDYTTPRATIESFQAFFEIGRNTSDQIVLLWSQPGIQTERGLGDICAAATVVRNTLPEPRRDLSPIPRDATQVTLNGCVVATQSQFGVSA